MIHDEIKSYELTISDVCESSFLGKCIGEHERIKLFHWVEISLLPHACLTQIKLEMSYGTTLGWVCMPLCTLSYRSMDWGFWRDRLLTSVIITIRGKSGSPSFSQTLRRSWESLINVKINRFVWCWISRVYLEPKTSIYKRFFFNWLI